MRHIINPQDVRGIFNQMIDTPLGRGRAFGIMRLKDAHQESVGEAVVVRLPVNETTRPHLKAANCLTPRSEKTALFTFALTEVQA